MRQPRQVKEINRLRPKFVVVCGDLIDAMPSAPGSPVTLIAIIALDITFLKWDEISA